MIKCVTFSELKINYVPEDVLKFFHHFNYVETVFC